MVKNVIFDFDGTLVDTLDLALQFGNENQERFSKARINRDEFRSRSMKEALKHIGLPWYRLPGFVFELKQHLKKHLGNLSLFPEIPRLLEDLKKQGFNLYILSSNSRENIEGVLTKTGVQNLFEAIVSDSSLFGKHIVLARLIKNYKLNKEESLYIGDEVRDAEACQRCGIKMIGVSWGWDSFDRLCKVSSLAITQNIAELRKTLLS